MRLQTGQSSKQHDRQHASGIMLCGFLSYGCSVSALHGLQHGLQHIVEDNSLFIETASSDMAAVAS